MYIQSPLSPEDYRNAIKGSLSNFSNHSSERFTGCFIGKMFYLNHHAEEEFGSRITPHCAAVGHIKEMENGCELYFRCFRGLFCPLPFIVTLLVWIGICLCIPDPQGYPFKHILIGILLGVGWATLQTLLEITSKRSQEGHDALMALMADPIAPFRDE